MEMTLDDEKLLRALKAAILNTFINEYAVERVAFGHEKPGDPAPIDLYLERLKLGFEYEPCMRKDIPGIYIDKQERISAEQDYCGYVHDLFVSQMERIFFGAPKDTRLEGMGADIPLQPRARDYLFGILPLFTEVLKVEVEYNIFESVPTDDGLRTEKYSKLQELVTSMLLDPLKCGSQIDVDVKDFTNAPYYVRRLIDEKGNNFYLKSIDSYEYIFALFSLMQFKDHENGRLLELKMFEWERRHKSE